MFGLKKDNKQEKQNITVPAKQFGKTKKKKNTYIVQFSQFMDPYLFGLCPNTPLAVITKNGETQQETGGFMTCTQFANGTIDGGACKMGNLYLHAPEWREFMDEKLACTIIEYLDKETGKPALLLYPQNDVVSLVPGTDWATVANTRLNHASRADLLFQLEYVRKPKLRIIGPIINEHNREIQNYPNVVKQELGSNFDIDKYEKLLNDPEKRAQYIAQLNKKYLAMAKRLKEQQY